MKKYPNFIIGGTNKAGTTSVFHYLSDHPEVCGSNVKETGFFLERSNENLLKQYFSHYKGEKIIMEASTSYLALAEKAIPNMKCMHNLPKVLFILRNPVERIYSYYNFHHGHLSIPQDISFESYWDICMKYERGEIQEIEAPFDAWHLHAPAYGKYASFVEQYFNRVGEAYIKVMFFDDLKNNPRLFMKNISDFLDINHTFYDTYVFGKNNVTFSSKSRTLHKMAVFFNRKFERFFRQRPWIKNKLVSWYKMVNLAKTGYSRLSPSMEKRVQDYYREDNVKLETILNKKLPLDW